MQAIHPSEAMKSYYEVLIGTAQKLAEVTWYQILEGGRLGMTAEVERPFAQHRRLPDSPFCCAYMHFLFARVHALHVVWPAVLPKTPLTGMYCLCKSRGPRWLWRRARSRPCRTCTAGGGRCARVSWRTAR
jgi:hypothetical protein